MAGLKCVECGGTDTQYQAFSGGREYYCSDCDEVWPYAEGEAPRRVQMIADGRFEELRAEMGAELDRRSGGDPSPGV